jgi:D-tyrosyl-tRNA(Tyr) deacylase
MNKVAYFLCTDPKRDEVAPLVFNQISNMIELNALDWQVDDYPVLEYLDEGGNQYLFIRTSVVLCQNYRHYQPVLDILSDFDLIGMVNWHGGNNAPDKILAIHTVGDVVSGHFPPSKPHYATNIARAMETHRKAANLEDFRVTTEATHWSGIVYEGDVNWLKDLHAPLVDIEIGSTTESYNNHTAVQIIAQSLLNVFDDKNDIPTVLYIGGIHFEDTITAAVLHPSHPVNLTHILPSRWIDNEFYQDEKGKENIKKCIDSIEGGIQGFVIHEKLKKPAKDLIRALSEELNLPIIKRKALKTPENTIFYM